MGHTQQWGYGGRVTVMREGQEEWTLTWSLSMASPDIEPNSFLPSAVKYRQGWHTTQYKLSWTSGSRFYVWFTFSLSWQASHYTCTIERSLKHRKKAIVVRDERPVGLGNSSVPAIWSMSSAVMSSLIILCSASCIRWCILFREDSVAWHNVDCEWPGYL